MSFNYESSVDANLELSPIDIRKSQRVSFCIFVESLIQLLSEITLSFPVTDLTLPPTSSVKIPN